MDKKNYFDDNYNLVYSDIVLIITIDNYKLHLLSAFPLIVFCLPCRTRKSIQYQKCDDHDVYWMNHDHEQLK